jgi:hypothetical protein
MTHLINGNLEGAKFFLKLSHLSDTDRVFIPIKSTNNNDDWSGCILDVVRRKILYYDPKYDNTNALLIPIRTQKMVDNVKHIHNYLSLVDMPSFKEKWEYKMILGTPFAPRDVNENDFDSAIFVYTFFSMAVNDMPIIFNQKNIHAIRSNLCYNVLKGSI